MKTFDGKTSMNARVDVDYSKKQPKVKFSYPDRKNQMKGSMFWFIWILIFVVSIYSFYFYDDFVLLNDNLNNTINYNGTQYQKFVKYDCEYITLNKNTFNNISNVVCDKIKDDYHYTKELLLYLFIIPLILATLFSNLIYHPFKKHWKKIYPKFQSTTSTKKIAIFKPKDVKDNYVEIPYFKNVILDYKAEKDFAKYLLNIKIKEHNYRFFKGKNKKSKVNEWNWSARFYFKRKPRDGKLEVVFA
jgi:hypothetical protein